MHKQVNFQIVFELRGKNLDLENLNLVQEGGAQTLGK
jgi:hypothetical protein